jgi:hypothetical protein
VESPSPRSGLSPVERDIQPSLDDAETARHPRTDSVPSQSRASTPDVSTRDDDNDNDVILQPRTSTSDDVTTVKDRLDNLQSGPRPRFSYKMAEAGVDGTWEREDLNLIVRRVQRDTRWHAFLFHGSYYWAEILSQYLLPPGRSKDDLPADDEIVLRVKNKILDGVKNFKADTLKRFDGHVKQVLEDYPELQTMPLTEPDVAKEFFINTIWSESNFEHIWFWMKNYLNIRKSSELGLYFNKRKSPLS